MPAKRAPEHPPFLSLNLGFKSVRVEVFSLHPCNPRLSMCPSCLPGLISPEVMGPLVLIKVFVFFSPLKTLLFVRERRLSSTHVALIASAKEGSSDKFWSSVKVEERAVYEFGVGHTSSSLGLSNILDYFIDFFLGEAGLQM